MGIWEVPELLLGLRIIILKILKQSADALDYMAAM